MGAVGIAMSKSYVVSADNSILNYNGDENALSSYLNGLGRPLKQSEFTVKSVYVGSQMSNGMQYGYKIIPPKGFPIDVYKTVGTKSGAKNIIKGFVTDYNKWYEENK